MNRAIVWNDANPRRTIRPKGDPFQAPREIDANITNSVPYRTFFVFDVSLK
ncbi:hypothetical protein [Pyrococcus sp. NA2]|uniref:hypothetical protein n=1 Tax=Pyrococcus sp. (strain NA2) TaxID=342949 RepID=UPI0035251AF3